MALLQPKHMPHRHLAWQHWINPLSVLVQQLRSLQTGRRAWYVQVTQLEQNMNFLVGTMFLLQVFISVLCALGQNAFNTSRLAQMWYVTAPM